MRLGWKCAKPPSRTCATSPKTLDLFHQAEKQTQGGTKFTPHRQSGFTGARSMFDGIAESMEETLDYWSPDGRPLRASVSL